MVDPQAVEAWLNVVLKGAAIVGLAGSAVGALFLYRLLRAVRAVEYHLRPNGHEDMLSEDERDQPVRLLVLGLVRDLRPLSQRLAEAMEWQREHEIVHARRYAAETMGGE